MVESWRQTQHSQVVVASNTALTGGQGLWQHSQVGRDYGQHSQVGRDYGQHSQVGRDYEQHSQVGEKVGER